MALVVAVALELSLIVLSLTVFNVTYLLVRAQMTELCNIRAHVAGLHSWLGVVFL